MNIDPNSNFPAAFIFYTQKNLGVRFIAAVVGEDWERRVGEVKHFFLTGVVLYFCKAMQNDPAHPAHVRWEGGWGLLGRTGEERKGK